MLFLDTNLQVRMLSLLLQLIFTVTYVHMTRLTPLYRMCTYVHVRTYWGALLANQRMYTCACMCMVCGTRWVLTECLSRLLAVGVPTREKRDSIVSHTANGTITPAPIYRTLYLDPQLDLSLRHYTRKRTDKYLRELHKHLRRLTVRLRLQVLSKFKKT